MVMVKEELKPAGLRALANPLYDTEEFPAAANPVNNLTFFQTSLGGALPVSAAVKTLAETNVRQSGMIGEPQEFLVYGFQCSIMWDMDYIDNNVANETVGNFLDDMSEIYEQSVFTFRYNQKEFLSVPFTRIPHGPFMLTGPADSASDNATNAGLTFFFVSNGESSTNEWLPFMVDDEPSKIHSTENFQCQISYPNAQVGLTAGGDESRARVYIVGVLFVAL